MFCSKFRVGLDASNALGEEVHADNIQARVSSGGAKVTRLSLQLSCRNLPCGSFQVLNTFVVLFIKEKDAPENEWKEFAQTEIVYNNPNPNYVTTVEVDHVPTSPHTLRLEVYSGRKKKSEVLGHVEVPLQTLVRHLNRDLAIPLSNVRFANARRGYVSLTVEQFQYAPFICEVQFSAHGLPHSAFKNVKPFVIISRSMDLGSDILVYRSEVGHARHGAVQWRSFRISLSRMCNGSVDRLLHFDVYHWRSSGSHHLLGRFSSSLAQLQNMQERPLPLVGKRAHQMGFLMFQKCQITEQVTFLDYIRGGCELNLIVGIDFTASNGDPRSVKSLHHVASEDKPNDYELAIRSICDVLAHYDDDKMYPAFGFGAKFRDGSVQHCFALNGNPASPECEGVDGLIAAYRQALANVSLHGPSILSQVIARACKFAADKPTSQDHQHYELLLIITDGMVSDLDLTKHQIVKASHLPLSIIIIGVGAADFSGMAELDTRNKLFSVDGISPVRDIVQFIPFSKLKSAHSSSIASMVLERIPPQFIAFFKSVGIQPNVTSSMKDLRKTIIRELKGITTEEEQTPANPQNLTLPKQ